MGHFHQEPPSGKTYLYTEDGVDHYANTEDEARHALAFAHYRCTLERCRVCKMESGWIDIPRSMYCTMIPKYGIQDFYQCVHDGEQHAMLFWNCDRCKRTVGVQDHPIYAYAKDGI